MRERGTGTIVNVTSVAGIVGGPLAGFYSATKFALEALSESLHLEVGHFGVKVLVVEPGAIATRFGDNMVDLRGQPGPYAELATMWESAMGVLGGGGPAPGPELVATKICDALEAEQRPLRLPVGADAELIAESRQGAGFDDFEAAMREILKLDW
jgi:short-subunit dehydrogenase